MSDYRDLATKIVDNVGGAPNITSVGHCITRLRFELKDESAANTDAIRALPGVMGVLSQGGMYQVVVGQKVDDVFAAVESVRGGAGVATATAAAPAAATPAAKTGWFDTFTRTVAGIFTPILGIMIATGFLKGLLGMADAFNWIDPATSTTYTVLYAIADVLFYMFPVFIGASAARYFGINYTMGIAIGGVLIYPTLVAAVNAGTPVNLFGLPVHLVNYTNSVFPAIIAVYAAARLERVLKRVIPKVVQLVFVPLLTLLIVIPATLIVIGPIVSWLSERLSDLTLSLYDFSPVLGALVLGGPWILIVMLGLHWAFIPVFINNMVTKGSDPTLGLLMANQLAMAGAAIGVALRSKDRVRRELGYSTGISAVLGVAEPALYGVLLPLKKPLVAAIIGGSLGAVVAALANTTYYTFGGTGIFAIPSIINPAGIDAGFYGGILSQAVGFIIGLVVTLLLVKTRDVDVPDAVPGEDEFAAVLDAEPAKR